MTNTRKTRQLTEGAIMAVVTAIIALLGTFIPLLNLLTFMVVTTPIILVILRNRFSTGVMSSIVAAFLVGIFSGPFVALFFYIQFMFLALAYGYMIEKKDPVAKIISFGTLISVAGTVLVFLLVSVTGGLTIEQQKIIFNETVDRTIEQYEKNGMLRDLENQGYTQEEIREMLNGVVKFITGIIPTLVVIASALSALLNYLVASMLLRRFQYKPPAFPPFSEWRMPWQYIWGFLGAWVLLLLGDTLNNATMLLISQNVLIAYGAVFFVTGISTVAYIFKNVEISPVMRIAFVLLVFFMLQSIVVISAIVGLLDTLLDTRKKIAQRKGEGK